MKKLLILFVTIIFGLSFASCSKNNKDDDNEKLKSLLLSLEDIDLNSHSYEINYELKYQMENHKNDDNEKTDYSMGYQGTGMISIIYDNNNSPDLLGLAEIFQEGNCYVSSSSSEIIDYDYEELNKINNETKTEKYFNGQDYSFGIMLTTDESLVTSTNNYTDYNDENNNIKDSFNGRISRTKFNEGLSFELLNRIFDGILSLDIFINFSLVEEYAFSLFNGINDYDDKQLNKLINDYNLTLKEEDELYILNYKVNMSPLLKDELNIDIEECFIDVEMHFNKANNSLKYFKYDGINYFEKLLSEGIDNNTRIIVDKYIVEGSILENDLSKVKMNQEFVDCNNYEEFITNFISKLPKKS